MCGIGGIIGSSASDLELLREMGNTMRARGPDDFGEWVCPDLSVGLTHRRLSILDLSEAGHQPMESRSGRFAIVYNGEIYNHLALRNQLSGVDWTGGSDTETILHCFESYGIQQSLEMFHGMFALAVLDREKGVLVLARDRVGEKPLYYGWQGDGTKKAFIFASSLAAVRLHPGFESKIDRGALCSFLRYSYVPTPDSIFAGIKKLPPGSLLTIDLSNYETHIESYWDSLAEAQKEMNSGIDLTESRSIETLESLLKESVQRQMISDVPLGAFLSGGIDSSTIVALMQSLSSKPVNSFTIGFHEEAFDEAVHARKVASHLGTDHHEVYVSAQDALDVIPRLPSIYDEPFADSSQIPTYLVSALIRNEVTVALSGDAGDELFCGYDRYVLTGATWGKLSRLPLSVRSFISRLILAVPPSYWGALTRAGGSLGISLMQQLQSGDRVHKAAAMLDAGSIDELYLKMVSQWKDPASIVIDGTEPEIPLTVLGKELEQLGQLEKMMVLDFITYLPDDILAKVDRAAMAASLETRLPFLDQDIIRFAWALPLDMKLRNGQNKWILRQVLNKYVPGQFFDRPKKGFGIPLAEWLRGPLKDWGASLLDRSRLHSEGYFVAETVHKKWNEHLSGKRNWSYPLWNVLMFQAWLESIRNQ